MKIAIIGTGYVGLVTGTCFAESGNQVFCVDIDERKIARLNAGEVPIYEPGLAEMVERNLRAGRLHFTTQAAAAIPQAKLVFLAVGTPAASDGSADLQYMLQALEGLAPHLQPHAIVVIKSTVPVGTNAQVHKRLMELTGRECEVANNPEFLREGAAIEDFLNPDRVVVGVRSPPVGEILRLLYEPFLQSGNPFLVMTPESAEMAKYVANAMLSTKISFINEVANLCEKLEADIDEVRRGIGHDRRIGFEFLMPGVGYGGSCFPKDVRALSALARACGIQPTLLDAVNQVNLRQKETLFRKIEQFFGRELRGKIIAVWGLAFKPRTDDIREASSLVLIDQLLGAGCVVRVHDPVATANVRKIYGDKLHYAVDPLAAAAGADALAIVTEWGDYRNPDWDELKRALARPLVFDGRNVLNPEAARQYGFTYYGIGKAPVLGEARGLG
ncbi:MAG: UDP-glucose/GDP-mannose dehydrogenase family protein [Pirellulales bacterium]|nr:UDP-glucose/GDP-mannose dehydrogenase family protein [Pirellulales bacterium]